MVVLVVLVVTGGGVVAAQPGTGEPSESPTLTPESSETSPLPPPAPQAPPPPPPPPPPASPSTPAPALTAPSTRVPAPGSCAPDGSGDKSIRSSGARPRTRNPRSCRARCVRIVRNAYLAKDRKRTLPDGLGQLARFQNDVISWHPTYGAWPITGSRLNSWKLSGYETSGKPLPRRGPIATGWERSASGRTNPHWPIRSATRP
ncbi:hypothetical protein [Nocardia sp. NPDC051750]|uniref:hypothetical protein n=1 Tax=Nocardia sp. NPDC051750 TaxID=3364325 RepID=UPI0037A8A807